MVSVSQFVVILMDILHKNKNWSNLGEEVLTLIELFSYINYQKYRFCDSARRRSDSRTSPTL